MLDARIQPDAIACSAVMSACERGLQWGRALSLLREAYAAGLEPDDAAVGVAARAFLTMEAEPHEGQHWRCSLELIARSREDDVPASTALCSNAINACAKGKHWVLAVDILRGMRRGQVAPGRLLYNNVASACGTAQEERMVERLQREMQESSVEPNTITLTAALTAFQAAQWHRSSQMLEELSARGMESDLISNTAAVNLHSKGQQWVGALDFFAKVNLPMSRPNSVAFGTISSTCAQGRKWDGALYFIERMRRGGLELHMVAFNAAMVAFGRCHQLEQAQDLLRSYQRSGTVLSVPAYSTSITAFAEGQQWWRAMDLLEEMGRLRLRPDVIALTSAISAVKKGGQWEQALELLRQALASGTEITAVVYNAAASALESGQQWEAALSLLQEMEGRSITPDHVTYSTLISACEKGKCWELALGLLQEMRTAQHLPDLFACSAAISACGVCGRWEAALDLLRDVGEAALEAQVITHNAVISACERGGQWQRAVQLLRTMPSVGLSQDVIGFNAAILACISCHQWASALQLFGEMGERSIQPDSQGYRLLLTESELRGQPEREAALLTEVRDAIFPGRDSPVRVRLLDGVGPEEQEEERRPVVPSRGKGLAPEPSRPASDPRRWLTPRSRAPRLPRGLAHGPASARAAPGTLYAKELGLLEHVLTTASRGDPSSVCAAIERYGDKVLRGASWLKVAGGPKAVALVAAARAAPAKPAAVLEIGAYCGYSALQLAVAVPGVRVVSLEVDAAHMLIARNVIAFAGLSSDLDVLTGHSRDLLPRLAPRYRAAGSSSAFSAVFMDQRGSLYHSDLAALEAQGLLQLPGAVVVADNVLKPGAPLFLRRTSAESGRYESQVVTVREFAMRGAVEDWMSVVVALRGAGLPVGGGSDDIEDLEPELLQLDREADRMRERAIMPGRGVDFGEWAAFVKDARLRLEALGIWETAESLEV